MENNFAFIFEEKVYTVNHASNHRIDGRMDRQTDRRTRVSDPLSLYFKGSLLARELPSEMTDNRPLTLLLSTTSNFSSLLHETQNECSLNSRALLDQKGVHRRPEFQAGRSVVSSFRFLFGDKRFVCDSRASPGGPVTNARISA